MSAYSTQKINRIDAINRIERIKRKKKFVPENQLSNQEIEEIINEYAYSGEHNDILGCLYNFDVVD